MSEYTVLEPCDLGYIFQEIYENLLFSYSSGCTDVRIYVRSSLVISYLDKWMPGWIRRAGPGGVWKNSRGNIKKYFLYFL